MMMIDRYPVSFAEVLVSRSNLEQLLYASKIYADGAFLRARRQSELWEQDDYMSQLVQNMDAKEDMARKTRRDHRIKTAQDFA